MKARRAYTNGVILLTAFLVGFPASLDSGSLLVFLSCFRVCVRGNITAGKKKACSGQVTAHSEQNSQQTGANRSCDTWCYTHKGRWV
jgi:hypothetical protein